MPTPSELVTEAFAQAEAYALAAQEKLETHLDAMAAAVTNTPLVDVAFQPIADPGVTPPPVYVEPDAYTSTMLDTTRDAITTRLAGGTGLEPAVESALWDRARERELAAAQGSIDTITNELEALGWALPPGVLVHAIYREERAYFDKQSELSRDIAIKQADLEQANMQKTIEHAMTFEGVLADIYVKRTGVAVDKFKVEVLTFQAIVEQDVKHWEAQIRQYEAIQNYVFNGQKLNAEILRANSSALLEAGKVGAQVYAQLTASAYSLIHASASVSASASNGVSYSYSNDTATAPPSVTAV